MAAGEPAGAGLASSSGGTVAEIERLTLEEVVAIDFHTHVEMSEAGGDSLPDELRDAAVRALPRPVGAPDGRGARASTTASGG